jgi:hypothetical protein
LSFQKSVEKTIVELKFERMTGALQKDLCAYMTISRLIIFKIRNFLFKVVEEIKTHVLCSTTFFPGGGGGETPFMR